MTWKDLRIPETQELRHKKTQVAYASKYWDRFHKEFSGHDKAYYSIVMLGANHRENPTFEGDTLLEVKEKASAYLKDLLGELN